MKDQDNKTPKFLTKAPFAGGMAFALGNGLEIEARLSDYSAEIVNQLALHGLSQKVGDSTASMAKGKEFGLAFDTMQAVIANLKAGKWNSGREGAGHADLISAIAKLKKLDEATVATAVRGADEATVKAWMKNAKIAAEMAAIKAARTKQAAKDADDADFEFEV